ncbi:MAG: DUF4231 domain-containing protein [Ferruginibacter sp.]
MSKGITEKDKYINIIDNLDVDRTQKEVLKTTWLDYLLLMNKSARKGWFSHNYSQIIVIVFSLLIPVIEKSKINTICNWDLTVVSFLGLIVAALTTLNRQLGFEEKWRHYRKTSEAMRNEGDDYFALAGEYEKYETHKAAFKTFAKTVTTFKRLEVNTYIEEEQRRNNAQQNTSNKPHD